MPTEPNADRFGWCKQCRKWFAKENIVVFPSGNTYCHKHWKRHREEERAKQQKRLFN